MSIFEESPLTPPELCETKLIKKMDLPDELLKGAIDVHAHAGPHLKSSPRRMDPIDLTIAAKNAGMRALVFMDIFENSSGTAWMINRHFDGIKTFGGIILNSIYGGMNPRAVAEALEYGDGARFVSFGAHCTWHIARQEGNMHNGKVMPFIEYDEDFVRDEFSRAIRIPLEGAPSRELDKILNLIAEHPQTYLMSGHVSGAEAVRLCHLAKEYKIKKVFISHVAQKNMTLDEAKEAVDLGALLESTMADFCYPRGPQRFHYYVEEKYCNINPPLPNPRGSTIDDFVKLVDTIGDDHFVVGSDYGIRGGPSPVEGMRMYIELLLHMGVSTTTILKLTHYNAANLLELEDPAEATTES